MLAPAQFAVINLANGASGGLTNFTPYSTAQTTGRPALVGTRAYVPLGVPGNQLAVVDLTSNLVLQYVPTAAQPYQTAVWNGQVYVASNTCYTNGNPAPIQVFNPTTNSFTSSILVSGGAGDIAIDPDTGRGYATAIGCNNGSPGSILAKVLDANTNTVTGTVDAPFGSYSVAIRGGTAYILEYGRLDVVDIASSTVVTRIAVVDYSASRVAVSPSFIFVATSNGLYVIDIQTCQTVTVLPNSSVSAIVADSATDTLYVLNYGARTISVYQLQQPTFGLSCTASLSAAPGNSSATPCTVSSLQGYNSKVTLGCAGLPQGASCSFTSASLTPAANGTAQTSLTVSVPSGIVPGVYPFQAADASTTRVANLSISVSTCSYTGSASQQTYGASGGTGSVTVGGTTGCGWTAQSDSTWLKITSGGSGNGNGSTGYSLDPNLTTSPRTGTLTVASQNFLITESASLVPQLSIAKTHTGNFSQGQTNAAYLVTVSNAAGAGPTSGLVTVTETVPAGLTLVSMAGTGWTCPANTCTRSNALAAGNSYSAIAVLVNVAANATSPQVNQVTVSSGGSPQASASDSTNIQAFYTISGSAGIAGATVALSGSQTSSVTADASGNYSFPNLAAGGNYTVTPSLANYIFAPSSTLLNNLQSNRTANFSATATVPPPGSNLAQGKPASQSNTAAGFPTAIAGSAVDGITDGSWTSGSVTHTNSDPSAWWQVDLGSSATVNSIMVWNRTDCCGDRLSDYWVFVSNTPFGASDTPATLQTRAGTWSSHQTAAPNPSTAIAAGGAQGRYVRMQLTGTNYLSLAEVQVIGAIP